MSWRNQRGGFWRCLRSGRHVAPEHHGHVVARRAQRARRIMGRGSEISIHSDVLEAVGDGDV